MYRIISQYLFCVTFSTLIFLNTGRSSAVKLVLVSEYGDRIESSADECRAGVYFEKEYEFSCACVTGV